MFTDTSIITTTPIGSIPMLLELQNIVFEFIYGSTALYAHKIKFTPVIKELQWRLRFQLAMEEKVHSFYSMLDSYSDHGYIRSFGLFNAEHAHLNVPVDQYRRELMMIPSELCEMTFMIEWSEHVSGPRFVQVWYDQMYGGVYMTQQFFPPEVEGGSQQRIHQTLADFVADLTRRVDE
jgi:hypothetical protein